MLPAIFNIFSQWRLTDAQQMTLLGLGNEKTLRNWKKQPEKVRLTRDMLQRASYILGIYKSLQILLPDPILAHTITRQLYQSRSPTESFFLDKKYA